MLYWVSRKKIAMFFFLIAQAMHILVEYWNISHLKGDILKYVSNTKPFLYKIMHYGVEI